jgi:hypothetical protein
MAPAAGPRLLDPPTRAGRRLAEELERLAPALRDRFVAALLLDLRPEEALALFRLSELVQGWPRLEAEMARWGAEAEERRKLWKWVAASVGNLLPGYLEGVRRLAELGRLSAGAARAAGAAQAARPASSPPSAEDEARGRQLLRLWRSPSLAAFRAFDLSLPEADLRAALRAARAGAAGESGDDRFSVLELAYRVSRLADWRLGLENGIPLADLAEIQEPAERFALDLLDLCVAESAEAEIALEAG